MPNQRLRIAVQQSDWEAANDLMIALIGEGGEGTFGPFPNALDENDNPFFMCFTGPDTPANWAPAYTAYAEDWESHDLAAEPYVWLVEDETDELVSTNVGASAGRVGQPVSKELAMDDANLHLPPDEE